MKVNTNQTNELEGSMASVEHKDKDQAAGVSYTSLQVKASMTMREKLTLFPLWGGRQAHLCFKGQEVKSS